MQSVHHILEQDTAKAVIKIRKVTTSKTVFLHHPKTNKQTNKKDTDKRLSSITVKWKMCIVFVEMKIVPFLSKLYVFCCPLFL